MSSLTIVADSGSTKTDWVVLNEMAETVNRVKTIGFNPYFQNSEFIYKEVSGVFSGLHFAMEDVAKVYYYGAGCSSEEKCKIVSDALSLQFPNAAVHVTHDLVAAARASLGSKDGIACIIGTGSNSCVWEHGSVRDNIPSHGYIFGDEGSGSFLGIELVKLFLEDRLPEALRTEFEAKYKLSKNQILNKTYREANPNVFLAHFAAFYYSHKEHGLLKNIIARGFENFFKIRVFPYRNYEQYELGFVGSIAYYYQDILAEIAEKYGMRIHKVVQCPIDALVAFHISESMIETA